ncbi:MULTISPECIES: hypothetical protein [unclassified Breznakia]|uniref:hypothetical protein n=1 Tax=unclassified Breznakia TaxID=2623764 RepID=UPI00247372B5|nr:MULTISPECIES: hypothetical protein [unclassified Breznakia]MDH6368094.1 hypothetical protein [Breznakia sp. PH1-1]MDH6405174.1 hypothetical protein [Breznakia sp. PF1-11]MDH6412897.1 hypothetical protein [Breznakia sp. PFB1-11]MDH6415250.1 hypothetical protein [Breznakia sp. PFB1-14]MDH6417568.1 hypothetical protein [Breznakia sp. PFB1-4]
MKTRIKKIGKIAIAIVLAVTTCFTVTTSISADENYEANTPIDYTNKVTVTDWDFYDYTEKDSSGKPALISDTQGVKPLSFLSLRVNWELEANAGTFLKAGDTFSIKTPRLETNEYFQAMQTSWSDFYGDITNIETGDVETKALGKWRFANITTLEVELYDSVNGLIKVNGSFTSGENGVKNPISRGVTSDVTMGAITKKILFKQESLAIMKSKNSSVMENSSNQLVKWADHINNAGIVEIYTKEFGTNFTKKQNSVYETTLSGEFSGIEIFGYYQIPADIIDGKASGSGGGLTATKFFTRRYPVASQSYDEFKNSLGIYEYGVYNDNGVDRLIVSLGTIGEDGPTYSELNPNYLQMMVNKAINRGFYEDTTENREKLDDLYKKVFRSDNVIGNHIAKYRIDVTEKFTPVIANTVVTHEYKMTWNDVEEVAKASGTLSGVLGDGGATIGAQKAKLFVFDFDDSSVIAEASIELQRKNGSDWITHADLGKTSDLGFVETTTLPTGTYRFVQKTVKEGYDIELSDTTNETLITGNVTTYDASNNYLFSDEFTVSAGDLNGHVRYMSNRKVYTVSYNPGEHGTFAEETHRRNVFNSNTPTFTGTTDGETGWFFSGWDKTIADKVTGNTVYTAQWHREYVVEYISKNHDVGDVPTDSTHYADTDTVVVLGNIKNLAKNSTEEKKYNFKGWQLSDGTFITADDNFSVQDEKVVVNGKEITLDPTKLIDNRIVIILEAVFEAEDLYTVTYAPGEYGAFEMVTTKSLEKGVTTPVFSGKTSDDGKPQGKDGYIFTGWDKKIADTVSESVVYTAQFEPQYNVKYYSELKTGGSVPTDLLVYVSGNEFKVAGNPGNLVWSSKDSRVTNTFDGWRISDEKQTIDVYEGYTVKIENRELFVYNKEGKILNKKGIVINANKSNYNKEMNAFEIPLTERWLSKEKDKPIIELPNTTPKKNDTFFVNVLPQIATNDTANTAIYLSIFVVSGALLALKIAKRRKTKSKV